MKFSHFYRVINRNVWYYYSSPLSEQEYEKSKQKTLIQFTYHEAPSFVMNGCTDSSWKRKLDNDKKDF